MGRFIRWFPRAAHGASGVWLASLLLLVACDAESPGPLVAGDAGEQGAGGADGTGGESMHGSSGSGPGRPHAGGASQAPESEDAGWDHTPSRDDAASPAPTGGRGSAGAGGRAGTGGLDGSRTDAAPPADTGAPCTKITFFADADGDGFGNAAQVFVGCEKPADGKWTEQSGDCNDGNFDARPLQTAFFGVPHEQPGSEPSYDYDCSGVEDPDTSQPLAPTACGLLSLALCAGEGHVATPRTGTGLNSYCGSRMKTTCGAALGILVCEAVTAPTEEPFRCR